MAEQCPFCQLVDNPDQLLKVHESDHFIAFLDINPRARGHTMVLPKEHYADLFDLPKELIGEGFEAVHSVAEKIKNGMSAKGVSIVVNSGEEAGQRVPHLYIQVFPRYSGEETSEAPAGAIFKPLELDKSELKDYQKKIQSASHTKTQAKVQKAEERVKEKDEQEQSGTEPTSEPDSDSDKGSELDEERVEFK